MKALFLESWRLDFEQIKSIRKASDKTRVFHNTTAIDASTAFKPKNYRRGVFSREKTRGNARFLPVF